MQGEKGRLPMGTSLANFASAILRRLRHWWPLRDERGRSGRVMPDLQALSDHELEDIGLRRFEIAKIHQAGPELRKETPERR
jgi:uncharacterized protein YjiS (DUF1127 family)